MLIGADTAFDDRTLTWYSASRITDENCYLNAKSFASKLASFFGMPAPLATVTA